MRSVEADIDIQSTPEKVFDLIHAYTRRLEWDTFLQEACLLDGADRAGPGIRARCTARKGFAGLAMETVYVSFERPRVAAVKMTNGPAILESFAASLRQEEIRPGVTRVTYRFNVSTRPRWLQAILDHLAAALFLREIRHRLQALKRHLEGSNEPRPRRPMPG